MTILVCLKIGSTKSFTCFSWENFYMRFFLIIIYSQWLVSKCPKMLEVTMTALITVQYLLASEFSPPWSSTKWLNWFTISVVPSQLKAKGCNRYTKGRHWWDKLNFKMETILTLQLTIHKQISWALCPLLHCRPTTKFWGSILHSQGR